MEDYYMEGSLPADSLQTEPSDPLDILTTAGKTDFQTLRAFDVDPLSKRLSVEQQKVIMKNIAQIFELEEEQKSADDAMDEDDDEEPVVDLEDQRRRTERLRGVATMLAQLWWADSQEMDLAAEKLADGSRDPKWRIPIGDSGVLNFFLEILNRHTLRHTLKIHVLRLIGNSCADTDENRARVISTNSLPGVISQLQDTSLLPFAIPVLYNICIDYEPAQSQASKLLLGKELIELISSPRFNQARSFLEYMCKILSLLAAQPSEPELAPDNAAVVLIIVAADRESPVDMDDFISLVNTAIAYLQHAKFQQTVIAQEAITTTLSVLIQSYTRFDSHPSIGEPSAPDEDEAKALQNMRSNLNQVLSDVSALPEFKVAVPVTSTISSFLRRWLSSPQLQLQVCACIMLGNLARSDEACEEFIHVSKVHIPLISVLADANDSQLLHAALGFLKNLALPLKNKEPLGEAGLFDVLPRLWLLDTLQQIQFSSISLARQLINNTYVNVRKITKRLSDDPDSPANMRSKLSLLIALYERTDVEPIKMEIARLITAVARVFNSTSSTFSEEEISRIRKGFYTKHPDIGRPLSFMVSQTKWPVVRSEGWFVFALMARTPEGAQCISDMMQDIAVFQPLVELLTGKNLVDYKPAGTITSPSSSEPSTSSPSSSLPWLIDSQPSPESVQPHAQASEMARIDRENALVLISELLKNRGSEMAVMRRTLFEDLLRGGGEIVLSYRENLSNLGEKPSDREGRARAGLNIQGVIQQSAFEL